MEEITALLVLALIGKVTDFLKFVSAGDRNGIVTQLAVWAAGVFVAWLTANADLTENLALIGGRPLGGLNGFSIVLAGLLAGSGASAGYDLKSAIDGSDSALKPSLLRPSLNKPGRA